MTVIYIVALSKRFAWSIDLMERCFLGDAGKSRILRTTLYTKMCFYCQKQMCPPVINNVSIAKIYCVDFGIDNIRR